MIVPVKKLMKLVPSIIISKRVETGTAIWNTSPSAVAKAFSPGPHHHPRWRATGTPGRPHPQAHTGRDHPPQQGAIPAGRPLPGWTWSSAAPGSPRPGNPLDGREGEPSPKAKRGFRPAGDGPAFARTSGSIEEPGVMGGSPSRNGQGYREDTPSRRTIL